MSEYKVDFDLLEWQEGREGVRFKLYSEGKRLLRLVEFSTTKGSDHWCDQGHVGYVLEGSLVVDCNGKVVSLQAGDGIFLPSGAAHKHRAISIEPGTRMVLIEDA